MNQQLSALLQTEASKLEKRRKKLRFFHFLHLFLAEIPASILIVCVVISALIGTIIPLPFALYALAGAIIVVALKMIPIPYVKYHDHIKQQVLPKIFNEINSTFEYHPEGLDIDALKQSGIFASGLFSRAKYIEGEDLG